MTSPRDSRPEPCVLVLFGATGDLARRKLLPALRHLDQAGLLPVPFHLLGVALDPAMDDRRYRDWAVAALVDAGFGDLEACRAWCGRSLHYQVMAASPGRADYEALAARIAAIEARDAMPANRGFYLALPPQAFPPTVAGLGEVGLNRSGGWTRLAIEKPFGRDLESAQALNALVHRYFGESQVYRGDHYLGKEAVQNLLAFRFGNALFESVWNRDHIKSVQIGVAEELGIEGRAGYYETAGALRDMVQNHLTQLLTLTAMEVPAAFEADSIRFEKVKVLRSVMPIRSDAVVFGQYAPGRSSAGPLAGYREERGVAPDSRTETFVALRLEIENWRWQGVPFYLSTGKRLAKRDTAIVITFRRPPIALFRSIDGCRTHTNVLAIHMQPEEGFDLSFEVKSPGEPFVLQTQHMRFHYPEPAGAPTTGYETLLLDVMQGDQMLFVHADEAEAAWRLYAPLLQHSPTLHFYPAGSHGPQAAARLAHFREQGSGAAAAGSPPDA